MNVQPPFLTQSHGFRYTQTPVWERATEILAHNRIIMGLPHEPECDVFRVLRTRLLHQLRAQHWNTVAVTSPCARTGKSLVCANLAIALALEGNQTVLLVDMDFRQPRLAHYLGLPPTRGLSDYLAGDVAFEQILCNPGIEGLVVVPAGTVGLYPTEWAATRRLAELILELRTRYESRILLFDIPPLSHADTAQLLLPRVDGAALVVEDGKHSPDELRHAIHLLEGTPLLGVVLNKAEHGV